MGINPRAKQKKQKKAIGHIEKSTEQISHLQEEITNDLQTERHLEQEIIDSAAIDEQPSHLTPQ